MPAHLVPATRAHGPVLGRASAYGSPRRLPYRLRRQHAQAAGSSADVAVANGITSTTPVSMPSYQNSALNKEDFCKFVQFFRQASPYIDGHRGRTFVIVIPAEVINEPHLLHSLLADVALLHGLGVLLVLVLGAQCMVDEELQRHGRKPHYVRGYRVTDASTLEVAVQVAGKARVAVERCLSKGPSVPMFRRHRKGSSEMHYGPALRVVSGNYIAAKRRGIVDGVDFGYTGEVRFVLQDSITHQLHEGSIVLLSTLGFSASGEVLNCNVYDVGLHAAVELNADKLFCVHLADVQQLSLPQWLPLTKALDLLRARLDGHGDDSLGAQCVPQGPCSPIRRPAATNGHYSSGTHANGNGVVYGGGARGGDGGGASVNGHQGSGAARSNNGDGRGEQQHLVVNLDVWAGRGFPSSVCACIVACQQGVKRAHLIDARLDGGLLLELYSRDGSGTMISTDFYEGIRKATPQDLEAVEALLRPLEIAGVLVKRTREELAAILPAFIVIERELKVLACALLLPLGSTPDGVSVAEIGAFCVDPVFRGSGRGDSLLDYLEQEARSQGVQRLVLLTTRTADWFMQRDFVLAGPAWCSALLPETRRQRVNPARNSQLYAKELLRGDLELPPGERIGF